jgi:hypothetical protein
VGILYLSKGEFPEIEREGRVEMGLAFRLYRHMSMKLYALIGRPSHGCPWARKSIHHR